MIDARRGPAAVHTPAAAAHAPPHAGGDKLRPISIRRSPVRRPPGRGDRGRGLGLVFFTLLNTGQFVLIMVAAIVASILHAAMYGPQGRSSPRCSPPWS